MVARVNVNRLIGTETASLTSPWLAVAGPTALLYSFAAASILDKKEFPCLGTLLQVLLVKKP